MILTKTQRAAWHGKQIIVVVLFVVALLSPFDLCQARRHSNSCGQNRGVHDERLVAGIQDDIETKNGSKNLGHEYLKGHDHARNDFKNPRLFERGEKNGADLGGLHSYRIHMTEDTDQIRQSSNPAIVKRMYANVRLFREGLLLSRKHASLDSREAQRDFKTLVKKFELDRSNDGRYAELLRLMKEGGEAKFAKFFANKFREDRDAFGKHRDSLALWKDEMKGRHEKNCSSLGAGGTSDTNSSDKSKCPTFKSLHEAYRRGEDHTQKLMKHAGKLERRFNDLSKHINRCKHKIEKKILDHLQIDPPDPKQHEHADYRDTIA
jgi:hypothetical protein